MSVSRPLNSPSRHFGSSHLLFTHSLVVQSWLSVQPERTPLGGRPMPPQSTSVSIPFCAVSLHVGLAHVPPTQVALRQSLPTLQAWPTAHDKHAPPPQSLS